MKWDVKNDVYVIDNYCPTEYFLDIQAVFCSTYHDWYYRPNISLSKDDDNGVLGNHGFNSWIVREDQTNMFVENETVEFIKPLIFNIMEDCGCKSVLRSRVDMTVYSGKSRLLESHVDLTYPHITAIYYVMSSDGNTVIYNEKYGEVVDEKDLTIKESIEPVANRLVLFDGLHIHTGHTPEKYNRRILINTNFN